MRQAWIVQRMTVVASHQSAGIKIAGRINVPAPAVNFNTNGLLAWVPGWQGIFRNE